MQAYQTHSRDLPRALLTLALAASVLALASCAKPASDAELAQAYGFYVEAPQTLNHVLSTANSELLVRESIANADESYVRTTEINQADKTSKITAVFKDYRPEGASSVTINGEVTLTSLGRVFSINGSLAYKGLNLRSLVFKNASLEQMPESDGGFSFLPVGGSIQADKRVIGAEEFFTEILK